MMGVAVLFSRSGADWRIRWLGFGFVLVLHVLIVRALNVSDRLENVTDLHASAMQVTILRPRPKPAATSNSAALPTPTLTLPAAASLPLPQFTVRPPAPIAIIPGEKAPASPPPSEGRRGYSDYFSAEQKEQFKHFFNEQAIEDRRENAKAGNNKKACEAFKKPDDLGEVGPAPNNGITKSFKPALVGSTGDSDDGGPSLHACN